MAEKLITERSGVESAWCHIADTELRKCVAERFVSGSIVRARQTTDVKGRLQGPGIVCGITKK